MPISHIFEVCERYLARVHLIWWLADGMISLVSGGAIGWLARLDGWGWLIVCAASFGATMAIFLAIVGIVMVGRWGFQKSRNRSHWSDTPGPTETYKPDTSYNFRIRNLFSYLLPDMQPDVAGAPWEEVGRDLIDRLRSNQLLAWGRQFGRDNRTPRAPLEPIPADRWARAELTYFWLTEEDDNVLHVSCDRPERGAAPRQYCDLRFNRAQVLTIWPEPPTLSLLDAARLLRKEVSGTPFGERVKSESISEEEELDLMARALYCSRTLTGVKPGTSERVSIPQGQKAYMAPKGGGKVLRPDRAPAQTSFSNLEISRADFARVLARIKTAPAADVDIK